MTTAAHLVHSSRGPELLAASLTKDLNGTLEPCNSSSSLNITMAVCLSTDALQKEITIGAFEIYITPLVLISGIIGSVMASAVLLCGELREVPCSVYLGALAVSDGIFLTCVLITWLKVFNVDVYSLPMSCEFLTLTSNATNFLCTWYLICLVGDRYLVVCWPHFRHKWCTTFRAKLAIVAIAVAAIAIHVNTTIMVGVVKVAGVSHCVPFRRFIHTISVLEVLDVLFNNFLPLATVIVLQCCIARRLLRSNSNRLSFKRSDRPKLPDPAKRLLRSWSRQTELRLTKAVALYLTAVFLLRLPSPGFRLVTAIRKISQQSYHLAVGGYNLHELFQCLFYLSFAIKPFVLLASWQEFRRSFADVLAAVCCTPFSYCSGSRCKKQSLETVECSVNENGRPVKVRQYPSAEALRDLSLV